MTTDTQKLADDIAKMLEFDARSSTIGVKSTLTLEDFWDDEAFESARLMAKRGEAFVQAADIIRRQGEVIRELVKVTSHASTCLRFMSDDYAIGCRPDDATSCGILSQQLKEALALAAPLVKEQSND